MNEVVLMGRLTRDPELKVSGETSITRYTLAVNRKGKKDEADFISCVAFNKKAEFANKYLVKGMKVAIIGHIHTGSYKNKEDKTIYTTDVIVDEHYFCESKKSMEDTTQAQADIMAGFMEAPESESDDFGLSFLNS